MIDIVNLQRKVRIETRDVRKFIGSLHLIDEAREKTFSLAFVSDARMSQLNHLFRGRDTTTDVLSFPHEPDPFDPNQNNFGDIVISADQAAKQAGENGLSVDVEIKQLILHGVLHLCGHDHETDNGEMNARELELREELGI
jgi:probable rRNA maturation factor